MKKTFFSLLMALVAMCATAQGVGDAFYIYRNDGQFNAFFRDEVDSIAYSYYDTDSVYYNDIVTQVIYTPDSIYRIPLAAIDSVGFVQPETIYREDAVPLTGDLFDYIVKVDSLTLTFDMSLPLSLTPHVGDKLVNTDVTDKLPYGFVGQVRQVSTSFGGIVVRCDSIGLSDAVSRFYGVYDIYVGENGEVRSRGSRKAHRTTTYPYDLPVGTVHVPPIELSAFVREKDIFDINYKNTLDVTFTPLIHIKVTRVVDDVLFLSHTNLLVVTDVDVETGLDISGEASKDWKKSFLPKQDFIIPPCIPFYFDIGMKASLSGEIAAGFTINSHLSTVTDITYYDVSLLPVVGNVISPIINRVDGDVNITTMDMTWDYFGARAELKPCVYIRVGIPAITHVAGWVGGEFDGGAKINGELMFDFRRLQDAEPGTAVYDELKDVAKLDIKPYVGAHFMAAAVDDHYSFRLGKDFDNILGTWYQGRLIPGFSGTSAKPLSDTKAQASVNITSDCPIPYTVGFALYDEDNRHINTQMYGEKYWTRNAFPSYTCEFSGLDKTKKYKVYPVIRFFGKHDMLASPSADLIMHFPVSIDDFKQTKSQYKKGGFTHEGVSYDYRYDVAVTVSIEDLEGVADWGYVYRDPNGKDKEISLRSHGTSYTDNSYAYFRNTSPATVTLFGYVKYVGSDKPVYGEPEDFEVSHALTSCPDANHPHMIDLGIGTKWACCNVGAHSPEEYGGYYAWGEVSEKDYYAPHTYQYAYQDNNGHYWDKEYSYRSLGSDISGTGYDVAHVQWGGSWCMPTVDEIKALVDNCSSVWTTENGVYGRRFTGPSGGSIFLPAAGNGWDRGLDDAGGYGGYWSSTQGTNYSYDAFYLYFDSGFADWGDSYYRYSGQSVRPVVRN